MATAIDPQSRTSAEPEHLPGAGAGADDFVPPDEDVRFEVIDGAVQELPPMGNRGEDLANFLAETLILHAVPRGLGRTFVELLFRLEPTSKNRRRPDVAFVSAAKWPMGKRVPVGNAWEMVPDLAIEVVSPSDLADSLNRKVAEYFGAGVAAVWVVYPTTRQVYVYATPTDVRILTPPAELEGSAVLPGFRLPLARLFEDDPGPAAS